MLRALRFHSSDVVVAACGSWAIAQLSTALPTHQELVDAGGCEALVAVIDAREGDAAVATVCEASEGILEHALAALRNLALGPHSRAVRGAWGEDARVWLSQCGAAACAFADGLHEALQLGGGGGVRAARRVSAGAIAALPSFASAFAPGPRGSAAGGGEAAGGGGGGVSN